MRILLAALNASFVQTSLSLRYLQAIARAAGHEVSRREFTINDPLDRIEAEIHRAAPSLLAFSCYLWNIEPVRTLADNLKQVRPDLLVLLGGPEVSFDAPALLAENPAVDYIICGEGERAWDIFLASLSDRLADVPGLCWRDGGAIRLNPGAPPMPLGELPPPYAHDRNELAGRLAYYESSRGCPFACAFCLSGRTDGVRYLEPARVLTEMNDLAESGAIAIKFVDRTFNYHHEHAMAVWQGLLRFAGQMRFHFEICADLLTDEELHFLATVPPGLFQFEAGLQSTHPETLAAVGRKADPARLESNLRRLLAQGNIRLHLDLIAGLPYEGFERFLATLDSGLKLAPDTLQLGFLKFLPGTRLRAEAERLGYRYRHRPPYEVLSSSWLSFAELSTLKVTANLIEIYFNERRFAFTLPRLFVRFATPAGFFAEFAGFSTECGWHLHAHQARDLPGHLLHFAEAKGLADPVLRDRLRLDLHCLASGVDEPDWAEIPSRPDLQNRWHDWLRSADHRALLGAEFVAMGPREVARRARVMAFRYDPTAPPEEPSPGPAVVAMVYPERRGRGESARPVRVKIPIIADRLP